MTVKNELSINRPFMGFVLNRLLYFLLLGATAGSGEL